MVPDGINLCYLQAKPSAPDETNHRRAEVPIRTNLYQQTPDFTGIPASGILYRYSISFLSILKTLYYFDKIKDIFKVKDKERLLRKNAANTLFIGICGKLFPMFVLSGGLSFQELGYSLLRFSTPEFVLSGATPPPTPSPYSEGSGGFIQKNFLPSP